MALNDLKPDSASVVPSGETQTGTVFCRAPVEYGSQFMRQPIGFIQPDTTVTSVQHAAVVLSSISQEI